MLSKTSKTRASSTTPERIARVAAKLGVTKIRVTGGEPLVRTGIVEHVRRLRAKLSVAADWLVTVRGVGYRIQDPADDR